MIVKHRRRIDFLIFYSRNSGSRMRNGKNRISAEFVLRVHDKLDVDIKEILSWMVEPKGA